MASVALNRYAAFRPDPLIPVDQSLMSLQSQILTLLNGDQDWRGSEAEMANTSEMASVGTRRNIRIVFLVALLVLPLQMAARKLASEPYPALFQPSFRTTPADPDFVEVFDPVVIVSYNDGTTSSITERELFHDADVLKASVFKTAFGTHEQTSDSPEVTKWMQERLAEIGEGREATRAIVQWRTTRHSLTNDAAPTTETTRSVVLPIGEAQ